MSESVKLSIIGPAMNEAGNLHEYVERCIEGIKKCQASAEIIIIDDGSTDGTDQIMQELVDKYPNIVKGIKHRKNLGLTQALRTGFQHSRGEYILWISSDLESHPDEDIPKFMEGFEEGGEVVVGYRLERGDGKLAASKLYNFVCSKLFNLKLKDMNWTKAFKRECLDFLELRGDWHRFIVIMLHKAGFKIVEKPMQWYPRKYGKSKFGLMRFPKSFIDLLSIWFLFTFSSKPMRLFGTIGAGLLIVGILSHLILTVLYFSTGQQLRPIFWGALTAELLGVQFILTGFVTELIGGLSYQLNELRNKQGLSRIESVMMKPKFTSTDK